MTRNGFSLPELLVSLVIASLVALMVHQVMVGVSQGISRAEDHLNEVLKAYQIRAEVGELLQGVHVHRAEHLPMFWGSAATSTDGLPQAVIVAPTFRPAAFEARRALADLRIARESGGGLMLTTRRLVWDTVDLMGPPDPDQVLRLQLIGSRRLVPEAQGLEVLYAWGPPERSEWTAEWISGTQLPRGVHFRLIGDSVPGVLRVPIVIVWRGTGP
jgi:prepilin-type N-terminal cleavage/methylation domain-containing protein